MSNSILDTLNENQKQAATTIDQHVRIIAGAGSGKTRVLMARIVYLVNDCGILPNRILAITFTNKAANEMKTRLTAQLGQQASIVRISTIHSLCVRMLREDADLIGYPKTFSIMDPEDQKAILKPIYKSLDVDKTQISYNRALGAISGYKTAYIDPTMASSMAMDDITMTCAKIYAGYERKRKEMKAMDFDDLLLEGHRLLNTVESVRNKWQARLDYIHVDEFQDVDPIQYGIVKLLTGKNTHLCVVGDPDQTIYTWRGAKNDIIKSRLSKDFKDLETVVLDDNYRSTQHILDAANNLIRNNKDRMAKDLHAASNQEGEEVTYTNFSNSDLEGYSIASRIRNMVSKNECSLKDIAIIYRANYLSNSLEKQLASFKIPYQIYGGLKFYERAEIKDALSYLRVIINPDDISFLRILQAPTKGVGDKTIERARELRSQLGEDVMLFDVFRNHGAELKLNSKSTLAMNKFFNAYDRVVNVYRSKTGNAALLSAIREYFIETGFTDYVADEDKKSQEKLTFTASSSNSKVDNVNEFIRSLTQALDSPTLDEQGNPQESTLVDFLISVALQSDQDAVKDGLQVSLMTGHVSKGLEFPVVFVTGVNQAIFPSFHALMGDGNASIEEERRLFYVCCTRAQKKLYVSSFGGNNFRTGTPYMPSQFIKELGITKKQDNSQSSYTSNSGKNNYYSSMGAHKPTFGNTMHKPETAKIISASGPKKVDVNNDDNKYVIGDKVAHITFGVGVVEEVNGNKIKVKFNDPYGVKTLIIGFKAFRKVKED